MKSIITVFTLSVLLFISCSTDEEEMVNVIYDAPFLISPANDTVFYSHEQFTINWELPSGLNDSEIQILESSNPINLGNSGAFNDLPIFGYGGQTSHIFSYGENPDFPITEPIYIGYRIRARDLELNIGYSDWTEIRTFVILPLAGLNKQIINVTYDLNFVTEDGDNAYYSGVTQIIDYDLTNIASENDLDVAKIKVVRPIGVNANFISQTSDGENPFNTITFGFDESLDSNNSVYPFNPLGQVFPGTDEESPINAQLYNQEYVNLNNELRNYTLKMAYLTENDENDTEHQVELNFELDVYLED